MLIVIEAQTPKHNWIDEILKSVLISAGAFVIIFIIIIYWCYYYNGIIEWDYSILQIWVKHIRPVKKITTNNKNKHILAN